MIGGPFIQQQDRTLFQQADDERKTFALAAGEVKRLKLAVGQARLVKELKLSQQPIDLGAIRLGDPIEPLKQVIVNENCGNQRAVRISISVIYGPTVEQDLT